MQIFSEGCRLTLDFSKGPDAQGFSQNVMPDLDEGGAPAGRVGGSVGHLDVGFLVEKNVEKSNFEICVFDIEYVASNKVRCATLSG